MKSTKTYFLAMTAFWFTFGIITTFFPSLMNMFQTEAGVSAITTYSDHVWRHDGFDILAISILFFALSRENVSRNMLRAAVIVALVTTIAITSSLVTTSYWNSLFYVPAVCCLGFAVWGMMLAGKAKAS